MWKYQTWQMWDVIPLSRRCGRVTLGWCERNRWTLWAVVYCEGRWNLHTFCREMSFVSLQSSSTGRNVNPSIHHGEDWCVCVCERESVTTRHTSAILKFLSQWSNPDSHQIITLKINSSRETGRPWTRCSQRRTQRTGWRRASLDPGSSVGKLPPSVHLWEGRILSERWNHNS